MTAKSDKGRPSDGPQQLKTRRGGPKRDADVTPGERLLKLYNLLLFDAKRHYLTDLAVRFGCTEQSIRRAITTIERILIGTASLANRLDSDGRRYYQLAQPATADTLGAPLEEVRYLALCRDLAQPFLPAETHARLGQTLRDLATDPTDVLFGTQTDLILPL